jgi:hypothetical protein
MIHAFKVLTSVLLLCSPIASVRVQANSSIQFPANNFVAALSQGVEANCHGGAFGDVVCNKDDQDRSDTVVWQFQAPAGNYALSIEYASEKYRPVNVTLNGRNIATGALGAATGCWYLQCQKPAPLGIINLNNGVNTLKIVSDHVIPHIRTIMFDPQ